MKQRLWVISEVFYPEETSTGYYLTAIAEGLADEFDVKVLCGQPNYSIRGTTTVKHEVHNGCEIFRAAGTRLNKNVIPFRLINMLTLGTSILIHGLRRFRRGDQVLVVTTPPNMPFIAATASLFRGASYTLLIHDSYPEQLVAVGKLKAGSFLVRLMDRLNRWLFKYARKIIVVGRDMEELVKTKASGLDVSVAVIQNWAEIKDVYPRPRDEIDLIREMGLLDKLIVLHAGNIGHPTDVKTILECLKTISEDERFHFVFIGSGVKRRLLDDALRSNGLSNLTMLDPRPRSEQIEFLNACDIGLVSLVSDMLGAAMPSKTYNIMAAGKPLLALTDPRSELARVIDEENIGWHLKPGDPGELCSVLEKIYENRGNLSKMGERARDAAEKKYSLERAVARYAEEFR
jgi:glycosyltransferase involved in cell wall biosynthesis